MLLTHNEIMFTMKQRILDALNQLINSMGVNLQLVRNSEDLKKLGKYLWAIKILVVHLSRELQEHEKVNKYLISKELATEKPLNPWEQAMKNMGMGW